MGKLRHIALSVPDPWKAAKFYEKTFGMKRVGETDSSLSVGVFLSDGVIHLALLNYKSNEAAGAERGKDYCGVHHFGFWVDDLEESQKKIESNGGTYFMGTPAVKSNTQFEVKFRDPDGIIFDVTHLGWHGASKDIS